MKSIIICFGVILMLVTSCKKEASPANQPKLVQIRDSGKVARLEYNSSGQVSELWIDSTGWWQNYTAVSPPLKYLSFSYANNYVKATYPSGPSWLYNYIEYYFNTGAYPASILTHQEINGKDSVVSKTIFYYKPNSILLDSIATTGSATPKRKYVPQYNAGNVVQYTATTDAPGAASQTYSFTYNPLPNYYRTTSPFLFMYTIPGFDLNNSDDTWIPVIFSANAVQSFTAYGFTSNVSQLVNIYNQLQYEDWGSHHPFKRSYLYE